MSTDEKQVLPELHLHVCSRYFEQIKSGEKAEEYRLYSSLYWRKRLMLAAVMPRGFVPEIKQREYSSVVVHDAYKSGEEHRITFPWNGWKIKTITHPHFDNKPEAVFAIQLWKEES